jgi:hypothetical protein
LVAAGLGALVRAIRGYRCGSNNGLNAYYRKAVAGAIADTAIDWRNRGIKSESPLIARQTNELIELSNGINIEIATASYQTIRGRTVVCSLNDEIAFWSAEGSPGSFA